MHKHVFLTGEIGCGKSTALRATLDLLPGVRVQGLQTYYSEPRGSDVKLLHTGDVRFFAAEKRFFWTFFAPIFTKRREYDILHWIGVLACAQG